MKKIWILIILIILIIIPFTPSIARKLLYWNFSTVSYKLDGRSYHFLVADNPQSREIGLMYYKTLPVVDGMIFIFPDKKRRTFWNKNTLMDLTLYWIDDTRVVGTDTMPSITKSGSYVYLSSSEPVDKVIELK